MVFVHGREEVHEDGEDVEREDEGDRPLNYGTVVNVLPGGVEDAESCGGQMSV